MPRRRRSSYSRFAVSSGRREIADRLARSAGKRAGALAASDEEYRAIAEVYSELKSTEQGAEKGTHVAGSAGPTGHDGSKALELIPRLSKHAADAGNLAALGQWTAKN
jgi:hypothetical protein